MSIWRTKSIEQSIRDTEEPEHRLKRDLTALDLTVFGVGVTIGGGLFVLTGSASKTYAGPAIAISFIIAAIACGLAALCYAEFASTVPVAGSAYTFSYATLGELVAWIIGWDLILEFVVGAAAVAAGWSGYLQNVLAGTHLEIPASLASASGEGVVNLPAMLLVLAVTVVLVVGVKLSSLVNQVAVAIKAGVAILFVVAGIFFMKTSNLSEFIPASGPATEGSSGMRQPLIQAIFGLQPLTYGWGGIITGAAVVFFAFIGFDVVATTAEETRSPKRDIPLGIFGSLAACTVLYVAVSIVLNGMMKYSTIDPTDPAPLSTAFTKVGQDGIANIIAIGAAIGIVVVVMILILGQTRVAFAMSRDGLLPAFVGKVHPKFRTPYVITIIAGVFISILAGFFSIDVLAEMVNVGTLFAFILVSAGVIVLRRRRPDLERAFRTPLVPLVPIAAILICSYLMLNLAIETWLRFGVWMLIGVAVYFLYGRRHARIGREAPVEPANGPDTAD